MTLRLIALLTVLTTSMNWAQNPTSSLTGRVLYPDGSAVPNAPIQLKNKTTSAAVRTKSGRDGTYTLAKVAPGKYEFTLVMPCCAYSRVNNEIELAPGKAGQFDVNLVETINGSTLGDDPARLAEAMRNRARVPTRPTPRTPNGKPDLSGVWLLTDDPYPEAPQMLPATLERMAALQKDPKSPPHNRCLPGPPPLPGSASPFIAKLVQTPGLLVALFEDYPGFRQIFLDGRKRPEIWEPSWMGYSVGHWEKDDLIVETTGFNDRSLLGGIGGGPVPHTEALRMTERYRRVDYGHIDLKITFEDPQAFAKPYHENLTLSLTPQEELMEYVCENNKPEHYVADR